MKKTLLALLAGVAIGILIAPAKGSKTRKKLASTLGDFKDSITDQLDETLEKVKSVVK